MHFESAKFEKGSHFLKNLSVRRIFTAVFLLPALTVCHAQERGECEVDGSIEDMRTRFPEYTIPGCTPQDEAVRLCEGFQAAQGRVQILHPSPDNSEWGEICDAFFGFTEAQVIARMLCFLPEFARAHPGGTFGDATVGPVVHRIECNGTESSVYQCFDESEWGIVPCGNHQVAAASFLPPDLDAPQPSPVPLVTCNTGHDIVATFSTDWDPPIEETHLSLLHADAGCGYWIDNLTVGDQDYLQMHIPVTKCNTMRQYNATHILYNNTIMHQGPGDDDGGPIFRPGIYSIIPVGCIFPRGANDTIGPIEPSNPTPAPIWGTGEFQAQMRVYQDASFQDYIQTFPHQLRIGDTLHVAVSLMTDDSLRINVPTCWVTPTIDPSYTPRWDLFRNSCRTEPSVLFYTISTTRFGFSFRTFKFVGDYPFLYVHCTSWVCGELETGGLCDRTPADCPHDAARPGVAGVAAQGEAAILVNQGPLYFVEHPPSEEDLRDAPVSTDPPPGNRGEPTPTTTTATTTRDPLYDSGTGSGHQPEASAELLLCLVLVIMS